MKKFENLKELKRIHQQIKTSSTGSPTEFSKILGITKRQLFSYLEYLKELGALIAYDRLQATYYYENYFDLKISLHMAVVTDEGNDIIHAID